MGNGMKREILERLERLERGMYERGGRDRDRRRGDRGGHHRDQDGGDHHRGRGRDRHRGGSNYDEKRIIDTIVRLVAERVENIVRERPQANQYEEGRGGEKRIVDLVVHLVAERVEEIVEQAFERYLLASIDLDEDHGACGHDHGEPEAPAARRKPKPAPETPEDEE